MKRTLQCKLSTKDGHEAHIHRQRNAMLVFRHVYYVSIYSKNLYQGNRRAVIYGWSGTDLEKLKGEVRKWSTDVILKDNPYLASALRIFLQQPA